MNRSEALIVLGLDSNASLDDIKRAYRLLALKYHPDKHANKTLAPGDSSNYDSNMFIQVKEAYDILTTESFDSESKFSWCSLSPGINELFELLLQNDRIKDIIIKQSVELFASISCAKQMAIYKILVLHKDYLHLSDDFLSQCSEIISSGLKSSICSSKGYQSEGCVSEGCVSEGLAFENYEYYILNPTIADLIGQCVYKLERDGHDCLYVPLWHPRVIIDNVIIDCVLPRDGLTEQDNQDFVDANGDVHLHISLEISNVLKTGFIDCGYNIIVDASELRIVESQTIVLSNKGIPKCNSLDIYDTSILGDVYIYLTLI